MQVDALGRSVQVAVRIGFHEHVDYSPLVEDIFQGRAEIKNGYAWINERPGWGIEFNEALAARYPPTDDNPRWTVSRLPDGSIWRP